MVPGDRQRPRGGRGGDRKHRPDGRRALQGDLQGDHAAERAAGHEREPLDAERVQQGPLGPGLVAGGDGWERLPVRLAGSRVDLDRPGCPVPAAQQVRAEDPDPVGVERPAGPDERRPPVPGRVRAAGEGMDDEDLRCLFRPGSVVPVGDAESGQARSVDEVERTEVAGHDGPRVERRRDRRPELGRRAGTGRLPTPRRGSRDRPGAGRPATTARRRRRRGRRSPPPRAPGRGPRGCRRRAPGRSRGARGRRSRRPPPAPPPTAAGAWWWPGG